MAVFHTEPRVVTKHSAEAFNLTFDFTDFVPSGSTVSTAATTATRKSDLATVTSDILGSFTVQAGNLTVKGTVSGGEAGELYFIRCAGTLDTGETLTLVTELYVVTEWVS